MTPFAILNRGNLSKIHNNCQFHNYLTIRIIEKNNLEQKDIFNIIYYKLVHEIIKKFSDNLNFKKRRNES